jgi:peptidoglycan/LPS O-acetylase OafA/YrhL
MPSHWNRHTRVGSYNLLMRDMEKALKQGGSLTRTIAVVERSNLDLLRSVAITLVVVDHTMLAMGIETIGTRDVGDIGLFGVYLFFVHTSLVLMWSLERRPNTLDFYIRRVFRLYPLAVLAILIAAFTHAPISQRIPHHYFHANPWTVKTLIINCLFLQDIIPNVAIIHGVTWSLSPELYMYVLLPCLFFYAKSVRQIWPLVVLWVLVAVVDNSIFSPVGNNFPILIPDFLAGIIAYVGFMKRKPVLPSWILLPFIAFLLYCYIHVHRIRSDWFACLALGLILPSIRDVQSPWIRKVSHTVATYSFGIYLFHPFMIAFGFYVLAGGPLGLQLAVEIVPLALAAFLGYHLVEKPMIVLGARVAARLAHERGLPSKASLENLEPAP